jgi:aminoglycoside phosphotransferase (APT) family kinase protein
MTDRVLHEDELAIDVALVRALVARALPNLSNRELRPLAASGSSNALFRLGTDLLVRLPRQPGGTATIDKEARWLPVVAPALPVAVPEVVAVCEPDLGYPERWSVTRWIDGDAPGVVRAGAPLGSRHALAQDLAAVIGRLRAVEVPDAALRDPALRWYRGQPLSELDADFHECVAQCRRIPGLDLDLDAALAVWEDALAFPAASVRPQWYHGDLLAENLIARDDRLVAVLDFGGLAVGDPTVDLVVAWEVLDDASRASFRTLLRVEEGEWSRARAWALFIATMTFPYYWRTMPGRCAHRLAMARSALREPRRQQ